jgi:hypothetical protein
MVSKATPFETICGPAPTPHREPSKELELGQCKRVLDLSGGWMCRAASEASSVSGLGGVHTVGAELPHKVVWTSVRHLYLLHHPPQVEELDDSVDGEASTNRKKKCKIQSYFS